MSKEINEKFDYLTFGAAKASLNLPSCRTLSRTPTGEILTSFPLLLMLSAILVNTSVNTTSSIKFKADLLIASLNPFFLILFVADVNGIVLIV
jgi:hypothetical protein